MVKIKVKMQKHDTKKSNRKSLTSFLAPYVATAQIKTPITLTATTVGAAKIKSEFSLPKVKNERKIKKSHRIHNPKFPRKY